jgi:hypothetical protein
MAGLALAELLFMSSLKVAQAKSDDKGEDRGSLGNLLGLVNEFS